MEPYFLVAYKLLHDEWRVEFYNTKEEAVKRSEEGAHFWKETRVMSASMIARHGPLDEGGVMFIKGKAIYDKGTMS